MASNDPFLRWFVPWLRARPDNTPIGWYSVTDLEAAFHAGHHATDGRPGRSSLPPEESAQTRDAPGRAGPAQELGPG